MQRFRFRKFWRQAVLPRFQIIHILIGWLCFVCRHSSAEEMNRPQQVVVEIRDASTGRLIPIGGRPASHTSAVVSNTASVTGGGSHTSHGGSSVGGSTVTVGADPSNSLASSASQVTVVTTHPPVLMDARDQPVSLESIN